MTYRIDFGIPFKCHIQIETFSDGPLRFNRQNTVVFMVFNATKGALCVLLLPMIGYGWGHWDYALPAQAPELLIRLLCAWACFHCASMWMNADLDQDESEVIFGHPAPIPGSVRHFSFSASILGIAVCGSISWVLMGIGICTAVLGWMYSSKSICWKSHPVAGPLVNGVGYGVLSPLAGWWIVDVPMTARTVMTGATLVMGVMGTYFCLQGYQYEVDKKRGYRTFVAVYGSSAVLRFGRVCFAGVVVHVVLLATIGWYPSLTLLIVPLWYWFDRWIRQWSHSASPDQMFWPIGFVQRASALGLVFLACIVCVYVWDSLYGQSVAGLATRSGHPF